MLSIIWKKNIKKRNTETKKNLALDTFLNKYKFLKLLFSNWQKNNISSHAAALAYFTIFAIAPLIIICISLMGLVCGQDMAEHHIIDWITLLMGNESAEQIHTMIMHAKSSETGVWTQVISFIILLLAASGIFSQIQVGLNQIWVTKKKEKQNFFSFIKSQFCSIALVISTGFLLLVSLFISMLLNVMCHYMDSFFLLGILFSWISDFIFSLLIISFLFASIYKFLPDANLSWGEVKWGAFFSGFLFILGKTVLGLYLSRTNYSEDFGPASSLIVILIWLYYTSQVLFLGAEIIKTQKSLSCTIS